MPRLSPNPEGVRGDIGDVQHATVGRLIGPLVTHFVRAVNQPLMIRTFRN